MTRTEKILAYAAAALLTATTVGAETRTLLDPAGADLAATTVVGSASRAVRADAPRERIAFTRPLASDASLDARPESHTTRSREWWRLVSADELVEGVAFHTAAPGALVRINPFGGRADDLGAVRSLAVDHLRLTGPDGVGRDLATASRLLVGDDELRAAGAPFAEGTTAFEIAAELGSGRFVLSAPEVSRASGGDFVLHVFDRGSDLELGLRTVRPAYLDGDTLLVDLWLARGDATQRIESIEALVVAPSGARIPLSFRETKRGSYRGQLPLDAGLGDGPGLWEVVVTSQASVGGVTVERGARTGFAVALPTARLSGEVDLSDGERLSSGLRVTLPVEVGVASRFEVRGVLYGTDASGELRPLAVAHTARWLEPGAGVLDLELAPELFAGSGLSAPFALRDLQLLDQGRMATLHRQARAIDRID